MCFCTCVTQLTKVRMVLRKMKHKANMCWLSLILNEVVMGKRTLNRLIRIFGMTFVKVRLNDDPSQVEQDLKPTFNLMVIPHEFSVLERSL